MGIYDGERKGRKMRRICSVSMVLAMAWFFIGHAFAQTPVINIPENARLDADFFKKYDPKAPSLKPKAVPLPESILPEVKEMRDEALKEIENLKIEIGKNEKIILKSEQIISLAQQKGNTKAETVAREALIKAQEAKRKNEETLRYYEMYLNLLNNLISKLENPTLSASQAYSGCNCEKLCGKYEGFKKAMKEYAKTTQMITKEYQEWEKELRDAVIEGLQAYVSSLTLAAGNLLKQRERMVKGLEEQIKKYEAALSDEKLVRNKYLLDRLTMKKSKAEQHFIQARNAEEALKKAAEIGDKTGKISDLLDIVTTLNSWCKEVKNGDIEILDLLKDLGAPFIQYVSEYEELIRKTDETLGPMLRKLNLAISGFSLLRDVSYAGLHLKLSFDRLTQLGEVGEQSYHAMQSLIEKKKALEAELRECQCACDL